MTLFSLLHQLSVDCQCVRKIVKFSNSICREGSKKSMWQHPARITEALQFGLHVHF